VRGADSVTALMIEDTIEADHPNRHLINPKTPIMTWKHDRGPELISWIFRLSANFGQTLALEPFIEASDMPSNSSPAPSRESCLSAFNLWLIGS
jgi:hypothetical protein